MAGVEVGIAGQEGRFTLTLAPERATDGSYLRNAGIPTYGHSGLANEIGDIRAHGKDERLPVKALDNIVTNVELRVLAAIVL